MTASLRVAGVALALLWLAAMAPVGTWASSSVYVLNYITAGTGGVSQYDVGPGGALAPKNPATVAGGWGPNALAITPDGKSVYVANFFTNGADGISQYDVLEDGRLKPKTPPTVPAGNEPDRVAVSPNGKSVYVANGGANGPDGISQYDVLEDGRLKPKTPPTVPAGNGPVGIAITPDGKSVYVANAYADGPDVVSQYDVLEDGRLKPKTPPTVPGGNRPQGLTITPDGKSVYVANSFVPSIGVYAPPDGISQYDVLEDGRLKPKTPPTVPAGNGPVWIGVSPDGKSVYVTNIGTTGAGAIFQYDVGAGGNLKPKTPPTIPGGSGPTWLAVSPDGKSAYVANALPIGMGGAVSQYDVGPGGELSPKRVGSTPAGPVPVAIAMLPDQGPVAAFAAIAAHAASPTAFDGSASHDPDGSVERYVWSFGDGTSSTTALPKITHVYARPGAYTATLTVTDNAGCSTSLVWKDETAYCNGGSRARATKRLLIVALGAKITSATISPGRRRATFALKAIGHATGFQCALAREPSRRHAKRPKARFRPCRSPRTYTHLKPGRYTFFVRAIKGANRGRPTKRSFTIR